MEDKKRAGKGAKDHQSEWLPQCLPTQGPSTWRLSRDVEGAWMCIWGFRTG